MPSPSHLPGSFVPNTQFIDRDDARKLFANQCAGEQTAQEYRILNYYGIGGLGKTALCGQFESYLQQRQTQHKNLLAWAKVNFEEVDKRQPTKALLALRYQLADSGKLSFPAFDTAFKRYFELTQVGSDLKHAHPELFRHPNDILQGLASFTEGASGVPFVGALVEAGNFVDHKLFMRNWMQRRGNTLMQGLNALEPHELVADLPRYLGADIHDWLQEEAHPGRSLVLLYDTHEALWSERADKTDTLVDDWLRRFVGETRAVLHVVLGRDPLEWEKHDTDWQSFITPFQLDRLSDTDAESFLQAVPIAEADIRQQIVQGAKGIPFYLRLQVDQYADGKRGGKTLKAADFGGTQPQMLARFTNHLPDMMRRALVLAACPRWLDETLMLKLCGEFLNGAAAVRFADLTRYSFWTENAGRFYLHAVMRDYQQADSREKEDALYAKIHRYLFEYYDSKLQTLTSARDITPEHGEALGEGAYHLAQTEPAAFPLWVNKYTIAFHTAAQWTVLEPLLQQSLIICQEIGDKSGEGVTLNNISQIYKARGDYATALDYLQRSQKIQQEIGDKSGEGTTLNNISQIYQARGDYATALDYLQRSLKIREEIGDKSGEGTTLNNISQIYKARGDYETALGYLQQSLKIQKVIGDKSGEGTTLNNISQIYKARGDYETALCYLQQSLKIRQEIGDKSGQGATLNNIATIAQARGYYARALNYLQQSLKIQQEIGDKSGEGATLNNMAAIAHARGDYATALDYLQQSLKIQQEIGDKSGEGRTLNNISQIYTARGDYATALDYLQRSLKIVREIGDTAGLCFTLFNMGHIHQQNNEPDDAMRLWLEVYGIAKPINLAQVLDALEELAGELGLPGRLAWWEALARQKSR